MHRDNSYVAVLQAAEMEWRIPSFECLQVHGAHQGQSQTRNIFYDSFWNQSNLLNFTERSINLIFQFESNFKWQLFNNFNCWCILQNVLQFQKTQSLVFKTNTVRSSSCLHTLISGSLPNSFKTFISFLLIKGENAFWDFMSKITFFSLQFNLFAHIWEPNVLVVSTKP